MKIQSIYTTESKTQHIVPLFLSRISAGFPNPADDYLERKLDLNEHLVEHPAATFFVKVQGESMQEAGIHHGDLLVVDRSLEAIDGDIVIAIVDGEFTVKQMKRHRQKILLLPANPDYSPIEIKTENQFEIWGIVRHAIKTF